MSKIFTRIVFAYFLAYSFAFADNTPNSKAWLSLHGSNTIGQKLAPNLAKAFAESQGWRVVSQTTLRLDEYVIDIERNNNRSYIEIAAHGSGTGLEALLQRKADLWMASRPVSQSEIERSTALGQLDDPTQESVIALDGLAIIINPKNPLLTISIDDVGRIFSGEVSNWAELGLTGGQINLHARDDRSGTFDTFKSLVLDKKSLSKTVRRYESSDDLVRAVLLDQNAIGFVGMGTIGNARALSISDAGSRPLLPKHMEVATEDYPLSRRLFLYSAKNKSALTSAFIEFAQSKSGQAIAAKTGFVSQEIVAQDLPRRLGMPTEYQAITNGAKRVSVNFRFESGMAYLDGKAQRDLNRLIQFLNKKQSFRYEVALFGFSDLREANPLDAINLSIDRADYIAQVLNRAGIPVLRVRGMGDTAPVADNATENGRSKNRRVEVWVREINRYSSLN